MVGRFFSAFLAGLALFGWVALCGVAFWHLYNSVAPASAGPAAALNALQGMMWPFTVLAIAMPLILVVAFGGVRAIGRIVELQKMVAQFPRDIEAMEGAVDSFRRMKDDLTRLSGQIITDINRANVETGQDEANQQEETAAVQAAGKDPEYVTEFYRMYESAKRYFYAALKKYNQSAPEPRIISRGELYAPIAKDLKERRGAYFDDGPRKDSWIGDWVVAVFETERNTRMNRATLLSEEEVRRLKKQEEDAGA
jgi:hypothetical protein